MGVEGWIDVEESAKEMLQRVLTERTLLLLPPPLHRVPLRLGNVVELVGPSPSAKTQILIQAAISCILPKEWNGVHYGGLEHLVMFLDLDSCFDILRLSQMLKYTIIQANPNNTNDHHHHLLIELCMKRFLYVRCYDSLQFLATLKTLHYRLQKEKEAHGVSVHFLMIDRKCLSFQSVSVTVVQEIKKLLLLHPMLVIATKATILGDRYSANEVKWNVGKWSSPDTSYSRNVSSNTQQLPYREYMPSVWQSFVTHRIIVRATDDHLKTSKHQNPSVYLSEWLLPPLSFLDKFVVRDAGVFIVS